MFNRYKTPKHRPYSVTDRSAAIASVKRGESQTNMSRDDTMPEITIRGWYRDEEKLHDSIDRTKSKKARTVPDPQHGKSTPPSAALF